MKSLFFLSLALLFLSSKVSSQNPNMFDFHIICNDNESPACTAMDIYNRAGQIISDNLNLNTKISVQCTIEKRPETFWGGTYLSKVYAALSIDEIRRYFPTALVKQVQPGFAHVGPDIFITINSNRDPNTFYGSGQIESNQYDFLELILHELQHGLGFQTTWYRLQGNDLFPDFDFVDNNGVITFDSFKENIFDYYVAVHPTGKDLERTTPYVQALNRIAGPSGKTYNSIDDFYNEVSKQQQQQGESYTKSMLSIATSPHSMSFYANEGKHPIVLETSYNPFKLGSSISHFANDIYSSSPDFLLISESRPGKTLEEKVAAYGNHPGEGMGPDLRALLATIGYQLRIPADAPANAPAKAPANNNITTTNSTDSKPKKIVNNRNKKKRIVM